MTNPMLAELDEVVRLMERATKGEWRSRPEDAVVILGGNRGGFCIEACPDASGNASLIAAAVNFLRTHHATLADMAKRLEAAERDAATERAIQKAAETLPEGYVITLYVENGSGYIDLTNPDGDPVYLATEDRGMAEQFTEATRAAAIDATQEGEG